MFEKLVEQSDDHSITEDVLQLMLKSFYLTMEMYVYVYVYTSWGINVCNRCKSTTPSHGPHSQLRIFYSSDHTVQSSVYDVGKLFVIRLTYVLYQWIIYCLFPLTTQSTSVYDEGKFFSSAGKFHPNKSQSLLEAEIIIKKLTKICWSKPVFKMEFEQKTLIQVITLCALSIVVINMPF